MRSQQGMTLIGLLLTIILIVFAAVITMRVVPIMIQYYSVVSSIKSLNETPAADLTGDPAVDIQVLQSSLAKRLDINGVDTVKPEQIRMVPDGTNQFKVQLNYQVISPLVYNVSLLFVFNRTFEVKVGSGQ
ncbi:MAG: DUF4845 domain-containing protein [Legionella sp.]|nr:MAG: DUF4845 domain-containing protein [Legionella sp.]PJD98794.1 MAG: DUF4845 domain-containing protein [Legionella sp.]